MNNNRSNTRKRQLNRNRTNGSGNVKSRIGNLNIKPKGDLRQKLKNKLNKSANKSPNKPSVSTSNVKSRLGLQSKSAMIEAKKEALAQLKSIRDKEKPKNDSKQITQIKKTISSQPNKRQLETKNQATKNQFNSAKNSRQDNTRRQISTRRPDSPNWKNGHRSSTTIRSVTTQPIIIPQYISPSQPLIYQQPQTSSNHYDNNVHKFIGRQAPISSSIHQSDVVTTMGNSVLVTNLSPKITEDEIAELFADVGPIMNLQIVNSTTALVTYYASQHASKAVKVYNFRLLDGIAMSVCVLPSSQTQTSTQPALYSGGSAGRMYADQINPYSSRSSALRSQFH